jgi:hypothetical protein
MRLRLGRTGRGRRQADVLPLPAAASPWAAEGFDVIDAPSGAGHRVLLQLERIGAPLGAVLTSSDRLYFFVEAGSTATFRADLVELGWGSGDVDLRALEVATAAALPLPPLGNGRWVRAPEVGGRAAPLPPAHLLLGSLAYACRRGVVATQASHRKAA